MSVSKSLGASEPGDATGERTEDRLDARGRHNADEEEPLEVATLARQNTREALAMPTDPMPCNYHVLAAQMFAYEVARWTGQLLAERNASRRAWLQRQIERVRRHVEWHHDRATRGEAVPDDVAMLAQRAWQLRASANKAATTEESQKRWQEYRLVMRAAGHALKAHLCSVFSATRSVTGQSGSEALPVASQG